MLTKSISYAVGVAALLLASGAPAPAKQKEAKNPMDIKDGVLDEIHLKVERIDGGVPVVIRRFSTEGVDLGTGKEGGKEKQVEAAGQMVKLAPDALAEKLASTLKENGLFSETIVQPDAAVPDKALIIQGRFTEINPGSRAKRYWVSFGAGMTAVGVEGTVTNAAGDVLAEFKHRKRSGIGAAGGDYLKLMTDDTKDVGEELAKFLTQWASAKSLKR